MNLTQAKKEEKKAQIERLLSKGLVMVMVDTRKPGVRVPPEHMGKPQLALNLSYSFEIPDFKVLDDRVEVSLSFNKQDFFCMLSLDAIYTLVSQDAGEVVVFPQDVPLELMTVAGSVEVIKPTPVFQVVSGNLAQESDPSTEKKEDAANKDVSPKKKNRSHLKLVE